MTVNSGVSLGLEAIYRRVTQRDRLEKVIMKNKKTICWKKENLELPVKVTTLTLSHLKKMTNTIIT